MQNDLLNNLFPIKKMEEDKKPKEKAGPPAPPKSLRDQLKQGSPVTAPLREVVKKNVKKNVAEQEKRAGKSIASIAKTTPGTWEHAVVTARKAYGFKEGSQEDKDIKSLLWSTITNEVGALSDEKKIDEAAAYRLTKLYNAARNGDADAKQRVDDALARVRGQKERLENQPRLDELSPERQREIRRENALRGTSQDVNATYLNNMVGSASEGLDGGAKIAAELAAEIMLSPLRMMEGLQFSGEAAGQIRQGNKDFGAMDVAGPMINAAAEVAGGTFTAPLMKQLAGRGMAILGVIKSTRELAKAENFAKITKELADAGVEDAYKVAKNLRDAERSGTLDEVVESISKFTAESEAGKLPDAQFRQPDDIPGATFRQPEQVDVPQVSSKQGIKTGQNELEQVIKSPAGSRNAQQADELLDVARVDNPDVTTATPAVKPSVESPQGPNLPPKLASIEKSRSKDAVTRAMIREPDDVFDPFSDEFTPEIQKGVADRLGVDVDDAAETLQKFQQSIDEASLLDDAMIDRAGERFADVEQHLPMVAWVRHKTTRTWMPKKSRPRMFVVVSQESYKANADAWDEIIDIAEGLDNGAIYTDPLRANDFASRKLVGKGVRAGSENTPPGGLSMSEWITGEGDVRLPSGSADSKLVVPREAVDIWRKENRAFVKSGREPHLERALDRAGLTPDDFARGTRAADDPTTTAARESVIADSIESTGKPNFDSLRKDVKTRLAELEARRKGKPMRKNQGAAFVPGSEDFEYALLRAADMALDGIATIRDAVKRVVKELGGDADDEAALLKQLEADGLTDDVLNPKPATKPKNATGLANQVQAREAEDALIDAVAPTKGKSAKEWQEIGRESGITSESASELAEQIATGDAPLTAKAFGQLLEGKRLKLVEINELKAKAAKEPAKYGEQLAEKRAELQDYLANVQAGKGQWSDIGRALQAGSDINYGNFEDVLKEFVDGGKSLSKNLRQELEKASDTIKLKDEQLVAKEAELRKLRANTLLGVARRSPGAKKATIKNEIDDLFDQLSSIRSGKGVGGGKTRGAASRITAEDIAVAKDQAIIIKNIALSYAKLTAASLEEIIVKVKDEFLRRFDIEIDDQAIVDAIATAEDRAERSELTKRLDDLRKQARRESSNNQAAIAARKKIAAAKKRAKEMRDLERQKLRELEASENAIERARLKDQKEKAAAQAKAEKIKADALEAKAKREFGQAWNREEKVFQLNEQIEDLQKQINEGRYATPQKKSIREKQLDQEIEDLRAERRVKQKQIDGAIRDQYRSKGEKIATGALDLARGAQLGADIGVLTRQGLFSIVRLKSFGRGVKAGVKSMFSDVNLAKVENDIENRIINGRKAAPIRQKAGLSLTTSMGHAEELSFARMMQKIPGLKNIGGMLERSQAAFINTVRADIFDQAIRKGFSEDELKLRAQFINNATGRGNAKQVSKLAQTIMTSPRYERSRWAMLGEPLKNAGILGYDAFTKKGLNRAAVENIKDMAGTAALVYGTFKTAELAGYEVNWDMTSSDFLKMRKGDEVWDISAGIAPRLRDTVRMFVYAMNPEYGRTIVNVVGGAAVRTVNPALQTPADIAVKGVQRNAMGETEPKGLTGFEVKEGEVDGLMQLLPLIFQSMYETWNEDGPAAATWAALREFLGGSVNRYPESSSATGLEELKDRIGNAK